MRLFYLSLVLLTSFPLSLLAQPSHDPTELVKEAGRYWVFNTGEGIWVMSSPNSDFSGWQGEDPVFSNGTWPAWINDYVSGFGGHFWAPAIIHMNGKWHLYYSCSTFGSQNSTIGLATTDSLGSGNWTDQGMVTYSNNTWNVNSIDADIFRDNDGKVWMIYGSYWSGIVMTELDTLTGKPIDRTNLTYVANGNPEAAHMAKHDGYYYLMFNRFRCCSGLNSNYQIFMGRSTSPTGPFLDKNGVSCSAGGGTPFLHSDGRYVGPGHFGLYEDPNDTLLTYHYYDGYANGSARMRVAGLTWKNGWPVAVYEPGGDIPDGIYTISNRNSQKVLEIEEEIAADGANVYQSTEDGSNPQAWSFKRVANGYYRISPATDTTLALEIANCGTNNGANARLGVYTGEPCQEWYLARQSGGYFRIENRNSYQTLEIVNAFTEDGANAQQWPHNEHPTQQWLMRGTTVGIEQGSSQQEQFAVLPNPTNGDFVIDAGNLLRETGLLTIINLEGKTVHTRQLFAAPSHRISGLELPAGIYLVKLEVEGVIFNQKLVVTP